MGPTIGDLPAKEILEIAQRYGATSVKVFGSRARGDARPDSDLDLLVEVVEETSLLEVIGMQNALAELLGIKVEVATMEALHPGMREDILRQAKPLDVAA